MDDSPCLDGRRCSFGLDGLSSESREGLSRVIHGFCVPDDMGSILATRSDAVSRRAESVVLDM